jgi:hypothetical protein
VPLSSAAVSIGEHLIMLIEHSKVSSSCGRTLLASRARSGRRNSGRDLRDCVPLTNLLAPIIFNCLEAFRDVANLGGGRELGLVAMLNHLKYDGIILVKIDNNDERISKCVRFRMLPRW